MPENFPKVVITRDQATPDCLKTSSFFGLELDELSIIICKFKISAWQLY